MSHDHCYMCTWDFCNSKAEATTCWSLQGSLSSSSPSEFFTASTIRSTNERAVCDESPARVTHSATRSGTIHFTVFVGRFGTFLRSVLKFSELLVSLHIIKKQFLILLNKLQMLWHIHANDYVQWSAVSYIIKCLCHVNQNDLCWFSVEYSSPQTIQALVHCTSHYMQNGWTSFRYLSAYFPYVSIRLCFYMCPELINCSQVNLDFNRWRHICEALDQPVL